MLKKFKDKGKKSYDFLLKSEEGFKHAVFKLCGEDGLRASRRLIGKGGVWGRWGLKSRKPFYSGLFNLHGALSHKDGTGQ